MIFGPIHSSMGVVRLQCLENCIKPKQKDTNSTLTLQLVWSPEEIRMPEYILKHKYLPMTEESGREESNFHGNSVMGQREE